MDEKNAGGIDFYTFVLSLASSAFIHLGDSPHPDTGLPGKPDLGLAHQTIDILAMLREKTKGNLTQEEEQFMDHLLTDLRLRYVTKRQGRRERPSSRAVSALRPARRANPACTIASARQPDELAADHAAGAGEGVRVAPRVGARLAARGLDDPGDATRVELRDARRGEEEEAEAALLEDLLEDAAGAGDEREVDDVRHAAISRIDRRGDPIFARRALKLDLPGEPGSQKSLALSDIARVAAGSRRGSRPVTRAISATL